MSSTAPETQLHAVPEGDEEGSTSDLASSLTPELMELVANVAAQAAARAVDEFIEEFSARLGAVSETAAEARELVDVKSVADALNKSPAWVYRNADWLGARRMGAPPVAKTGEGTKRRLEFEMADVWAAVDASRLKLEAPKEEPQAPKPRSRGRKATSDEGRTASGAVML
jgi:hypothetical protein